MKNITIEQLKQIQTEGLVLRGCGGDLQEWVDGINQTLTQEKILLHGDTFKDVSVFKWDGLTNLLFNMEGVRMDMGKLALWRLSTAGQFGSIWLSDFMPNCLGVEMGQTVALDTRPLCPLIGADGNVFNLMSITARTLKENDMQQAAREMQNRVTSSGSYDEALAIMMEYVTPVSEEEMSDDPGMDQTLL